MDLKQRIKDATIQAWSRTTAAQRKTDGAAVVDVIADGIFTAIKTMVKNTPDRTASFLLQSVEQVAYYTPDMEAAKANYAKLGLRSWVDDTVTATGRVGNGRDAAEGICVANLAFNYDLGFELELIRYMAGNNWHRAAGRVDEEGCCAQSFASHMSYHVEDITAERTRLERAGLRVIQDVRTISHTNLYLLGKGRKFRYVIFDTRATLGWDLKLIQRIEGR